MKSYPDAVPLAEVALARGETREITLRRVMRGEIPGERRNGYWFVLKSPAPASAGEVRAEARPARRKSA